MNCVLVFAGDLNYKYENIIFAMSQTLNLQPEVDYQIIDEQKPS